MFGVIVQWHIGKKEDLVFHSVMYICALTVNETQGKVGVLLRTKKAKNVVLITTVKQYFAMLVLF